MHAKETKSDFTEVGGRLPDLVLFDAPANQCIQSLNRGRYDALSYTDNDHGVDEFGPQVTDAFVEHWSVVGDLTGPEAGGETGVQLLTKRIAVFTETFRLDGAWLARGWR